MGIPKPKPRRKRGCAREGCKRRPHELNRNAFALRPPDHFSMRRPFAGIKVVRPRPLPRFGWSGVYRAASRVGRACGRAQPDPYLGPRRYPVT